MPTQPLANTIVIQTIFCFRESADWLIADIFNAGFSLVCDCHLWTAFHGHWPLELVSASVSLKETDTALSKLSYFALNSVQNVNCPSVDDDLPLTEPVFS